MAARLRRDRRRLCPRTDWTVLGLRAGLQAAPVRLHEALSLPIRPAKVACIAMNTRFLAEEEARAAIAEAEAETGLPADDPVRFSPERLVDAILDAR